MKRRNFIYAVGSLPLASLLFSKVALAADEHEVIIKGFTFDPKEIEVSVGDTINFVNKDGTRHTATALDKSWDTGTLQSGQSGSVEVTADMGGDYKCRFHPAMKGKIVIS